MSGKNDHVELAYQIARDLGEPKNTLQDLVEFLKSAPADELSIYSLLLAKDVLFDIPFTPVIESVYKYSKGFE